MTSALPSVALTYGWCRVSFVILQSLARRGVPVYVGDHSSIGMCRFSRRAAGFFRYRSPYADPDGFVIDVAEAVERTGASVLIAGHEDVLPIARNRHRFPPHVRIPAGNPDAIATLQNKWQLVAVAQAAGVEVPISFKPSTMEELDRCLPQVPEPIVIKPQVGNSAKGVFIVPSRAEARASFEEVVRTYRLDPPRWPLVQAFAAGTGYGVCLLYNRGQLRAAFCERYLRCKDGDIGTSVFRESVEAPELVERATALMRGFEWHGVVHLDFLYDEATRRAVLIEVNPRFWGALDLAVRSGVDFPWLLYRMAVDGDVEPVMRWRTGVRSRWILGELLHLINDGRRRRFGEAARTVLSIARQRAHGFDDFRLTDPLPLAAEMLYYGSKFLQTGSANPVEAGMIG